MPVCRSVLLFALLMSCSVTALAQDDPNEAMERAVREALEQAQREAEQRRRDEQARKDREESAKRMQDFLKDSRDDINAASKQKEWRQQSLLEVQREEFSYALIQFKDAREELKLALGAKAKLKEPARKIEKSTSVFLKYLKTVIRTPSRLDSSQFRNFTPKEMGSEALATAERIGPGLDELLRSETQGTFDIRLMDSLTKLQSDLSRLQFMAKKLQ